MSEKLEKRLGPLDALRGLAVLGMIPFHIVFFGGLFSLDNVSSIFREFPFPIEFRPPIGTGLIIFFFVTGLSLSITLAKNRSEKAFLSKWGKVAFRYGIYYLLSIVFELFLWGSILSWNIDWAMYLSLILGGTASFSSPIQGLSIAAILAFPLIFYGSWKKLALASLAFATTVGVVLYTLYLPLAPSLNYTYPDSFVNPLLIGMYSALKGVPIVLAGGVVGKLTMERTKITKKIILIGISITAFYIITPALLGSGFMQLILMVWAYPHAILFVVGLSLLIFGLFQLLEERKRNLNLLKVLGRLSIVIYFGHFLILLPIIQMLGGFAKVSLGLISILMIFSLVVIWTITYSFSKWKWGNPSGW